MSLMLTPATTEEEGTLRMFSAGPFAPPTVTPVIQKLVRSGHLRRNGTGRQGRVLFSITGLGERLLARCPPQR